MDRRLFLAAGAALAAAPRPARAAEVDDLRTAAREAWIYGLPLIQTAAARARETAGGHGVNSFVHVRELATSRSRGGTAPNNDTLYSSAWLDLSAGPVTITVPPTGGRYFSLALMDLFTNNFSVIGARRTGGDGGDFTVMGPPGRMGVGDVTVPKPRMPHFHKPISSPGQWVWAVARTLVSGPADLTAAHAVQDALELRAHAGHAPGDFAASDAAWNDYFYSVQQLIWQSPPPLADHAFFRRIAPLQLGEHEGFEKARFADAEVGEIEAGVAEARALLSAPVDRGEAVRGWIYPKPNLGDFGQDYLYRARTSVSGIAALPPSEAMYMRAVGPEARGLFASDGLYRLRLPGPLPVDGFWSLSLYEMTGDGRLLFTDNPIGRYSLGDRSGLRHTIDGGFDIWIGRNDPGGFHTTNWLPAPAQAPFVLIMRAYLPKDELLNGRYRLPPLERLGGDETPAPPPRRRRR